MNQIKVFVIALLFAELRAFTINANSRISIPQNLLLSRSEIHSDHCRTTLPHDLPSFNRFNRIILNSFGKNLETFQFQIMRRLELNAFVRGIALQFSFIISKFRRLLFTYILAIYLFLGVPGNRMVRTIPTLSSSQCVICSNSRRQNNFIKIISPEAHANTGGSMQGKSSSKSYRDKEYSSSSKSSIPSSSTKSKQNGNSVKSSQSSGLDKYNYKTRNSYKTFNFDNRESSEKVIYINRDSNVDSMTLRDKLTLIGGILVLMQLVTFDYASKLSHFSTSNLFSFSRKLSKKNANPWSTSLQSVNLCLLLSEKDKSEFLNALNNIASSLKSGPPSPRSRNSNDPNSDVINMTYEVCLALQRQIKRKQSLFGGNMRFTSLQDTEQHRNVILDKYSELSMEEKSKFDLDSTHTRARVVSSSSSSGSNASLSNEHLSYVMITILLAATGPPLTFKTKVWRTYNIERNKSLFKIIYKNLKEKIFKISSGDNKNSYVLTVQDFESYLQKLPNYLHELSSIQTKEEESYERILDRRDGHQRDIEEHKPTAGFNINIIWTPNKADEELSVEDIRRQWPLIELF